MEKYPYEEAQRLKQSPAKVVFWLPEGRILSLRSVDDQWD
jgi:hypothetical protein